MQFVGHEVLRSYGASAFEQARYAALIDQLNAHADVLVAEHGPGILREHRFRNDACNILSVDDLEIVCHMIETYRPGATDQETA